MTVVGPSLALADAYATTPAGRQAVIAVCRQHLMIVAGPPHPPLPQQSGIALSL